jgi:ubiquinone/menaquinone biosynthesis C-methylase UbiE
LAPRYDWLVRIFGTSYPAIRERLVRDLAGRGRVLELAAGTGQFTLDLARSCGEIVATDLSPAMVEALEARVHVAALDNVTVRTMSAYSISEEADSFDAVVCANALHVMETPDLALAEISRVLAPKGLLAAPTFCHGTNSRAVLLSKLLSRISSFVAHHRFSPQSLTDRLVAAGFTVRRMDVLPGLLPVAYVLAEPRTSRKNRVLRPDPTRDPSDRRSAT